MLWPEGTICVAIVGATIGETGILSFDACFPDSVIGIRPDPAKCEPEFSEFMLQAFKKDLKEVGKESARDSINLGTFQSQDFPIPDLEQQRKVIARLLNIQESATSLKLLYQDKLKELADLRQSLLQKAFSGHLTA